MLYRNMPDPMLPYMVKELPCDDGGECGYVILDSLSSILMKALSHIVDIVAHPGLVCLFYGLHKRSGGTLSDIFAWPVIVVAWHVSRTWSIVHSYHNNGTLAFWYYGYDVYKLTNLDSYLVSYIAEGACFSEAILCRLYWDHLELHSQLYMKHSVGQKRVFMEEGDEDSLPNLVLSTHSASTSSISDVTY